MACFPLPGCSTVTARLLWTCCNLKQFYFFSFLCAGRSCHLAASIVHVERCWPFTRRTSIRRQPCPRHSVFLPSTCVILFAVPASSFTNQISFPFFLLFCAAYYYSHLTSSCNTPFSIQLHVLTLSFSFPFPLLPSPSLLLRCVVCVPRFICFLSQRHGAAQGLETLQSTLVRSRRSSLEPPSLPTSTYVYLCSSFFLFIYVVTISSHLKFLTRSSLQRFQLHLLQVFDAPTLNGFMALGRPAWKETRAALQKLLSKEDATLQGDAELRAKVLIPIADVTMAMYVVGVIVVIVEPPFVYL